jgi:hypothetical protein
MKEYCLDTSGLSNPLEFMPEDIHPTLWARIEELICSGRVAVTTEIYGELLHLPGSIGACVAANRDAVLMEVEAGEWNWNAYISHGVRMQSAHKDFISEYNDNRKSTICLNDLTIIALAKTLGLPVVSMEALKGGDSFKRRRIPHICQAERVEHLTFNELLRREGIKV